MTLIQACCLGSKPKIPNKSIIISIIISTFPYDTAFTNDWMETISRTLLIPYLNQKNLKNDCVISLKYFFFIYFLFSLTSLSRLFHSYRDEPIGRWGETGVPRENHLTQPQAEHGLSHMWPVRGSNLHQSQR